MSRPGVLLELGAVVIVVLTADSVDVNVLASSSRSSVMIFTFSILFPVSYEASVVLDGK